MTGASAAGGLNKSAKRRIKRNAALKSRYAVCGALILALLLRFTPAVKAQTAAEVDIVGMSVSELQAAVDARELDYETITTLYLERIEAYGDMYECIITVNERALERARELDAEFEAASRTRESDLFGMPVVVKDNIDVKGLPTTAGSEALADSVPYESADIVKALEDAGAIIIAKANMDEFAFSASRSRSDYGLVKNAYDLERTAYGSSGGSAVCVAASLAPLALGTDTNSSIRLPASGNGIVGLRPTWGLLSDSGLFHYDYTRDTAGPMAGGVYDCALLLSVMTGENYTAELDGASLKGVTIGVSKELCYDQSIDEPIAELLESAIATLERAGATVVEVEGIATSYERYYQKQMQAGWTMKSCFEEYILGTSASVRTFEELCALEPDVGIEDYNTSLSGDFRADARIARIEAAREQYRSQYEAILDSFGADALIYPSMRNTVQLMGFEEVLRNNSTLIAPLTGMPAITVPMGTDENGLPSGLEFLGRANDEETLLKITLAYERARGEITRTALAPALYDAKKEAARLEDEREAADRAEAVRAAAEAWERAKEEFLPLALPAAGVSGLAIAFALFRATKKHPRGGGGGDNGGKA